MHTNLIMEEKGSVNVAVRIMPGSRADTEKTLIFLHASATNL
jgi:hypothetical protein